MAINYSIHVSNKLIASCRYVGISDDVQITGEICPVAKAISHLFPNVYVSSEFLYPLGHETDVKIEMPKIARHFITLFDSLGEDTESRLLIPSFEFETCRLSP